jgi:hypothetical protein
MLSGSMTCHGLDWLGGGGYVLCFFFFFVFVVYCFLLFFSFQSLDCLLILYLFRRVDVGPSMPLSSSFSRLRVLSLNHVLAFSLRTGELAAILSLDIPFSPGTAFAYSHETRLLHSYNKHLRKVRD